MVVDPTGKSRSNSLCSECLSLSMENEGVSGLTPVLSKGKHCPPQQ